MADIEWKPLPTGLWTPPAAFAEVGNLLLQAFTDDGVPTWEIFKKTGEQGEWKIIAKGTADSFEAAKAAALFEGGQHREDHTGHGDAVQDRPVVPFVGTEGRTWQSQRNRAIPCELGVIDRNIPLAQNRSLAASPQQKLKRPQ
jgi:hypothetical protein